MKKIIVIVLTLCLVCITLTAESMRVQEKETIKKALKFQDPAGAKELLVDNIFGFIDVKGYEGKEVLLVAHKTIYARTKNRLQKAKEEVKLDITEDGNTIDLYVDGPFRCQDGRRRKNEWNPGYRVHYDFEIKIPQKTSIYLKTVTDGDIRVENVEGDFEVKNVNGKIEMLGVAGSGDAHTVNGKVRVLFTRNPESDCSFKTINGDLELFFQSGLSADFGLKSFNGEAYSDFPVTYLPLDSPETKRKNGKYIYKSSRFSNVRVGKGGPRIKMDTLNGDLLINKR